MADTEARPRVPRWARVTALTLSAPVLAFAAFLAVIRIGGLDDGTVLALPIVVLPYAALATLLALALLLALRCWKTGALAVLLVVLQLWWLVPRLVADADGAPAAAPRLRVATSNAYLGQVSPKALVDLVRTQRIDVLAVEELSPSAADALDRAGIRELLPHRELPARTDTALYTRLPVTSAADPAWPTTNLTVDLAGHPVTLVAVHTYYPLGDPRRWAEGLHELRDAARGRSHDAVLLGDFNATLDHSPMRDLLATGLADTAADLGHGYAPTWPEHNADFPHLPPLIQIDHVVHGPGLTPVSISEHALPRSDHRAVVAELAFK